MSCKGDFWFRFPLAGKRDNAGQVATIVNKTKL